jgi:hypothetical protein
MFFRHAYAQAISHLARRPVATYRGVEAPRVVELLVAVELRLDAVRLRMLAQLAAPARVVALAVELEQQLAGLRLPRRIWRRRFEPTGVGGHAVDPVLDKPSEGQAVKLSGRLEIARKDE